MEPRVSVIVPNYNYGRYLAQAIDSVLAQTFRELEVIVVDDCSGDDSREVLRRYADDPRVRLVFHDRNERNIRTFNEGLALARGEFVGILCSDDFCLRPDAVARQVAIFDAHPDVGFVYSAQTYVDERGTPFRMMQPFPDDYVRDGLVEFAGLAFRNYVPNTGTLVRRSAHERLGYYDPAMPHAADWELWLRVATSFQVGYVSEPLYAYRIHGLQLSVSYHSPRQANREIALAVTKSFDRLPPHAPQALRVLRRSAVQHVLLATNWGDRSLGRVRRSWVGLIDAAWRSPDLLGTRLFYAALARTLLLTLVGHRRYQRLSNRRAARLVGGMASASVPAR